MMSLEILEISKFDEVVEEYMIIKNFGEINQWVIQQ